MKKYSLKKNLVALTLASALTINLTGCGSVYSNTNYSDESTSQVMIEESYNQEDYFFVYLNNNMYFTTRSLNDAGTYFDYFDVNTGDMVARMLKPMSGETEYSTSDLGNYSIYHNAIYHDENHFDGKYGYGKNVPKCALVPLNGLKEGSTFTKEEFDYYASNSEELKRKIQECIIFSSYSVEDSNDILKYYLFDFSISSKVYETATLRKYECISNSGETSTFIAYQCSYNEKDRGYNYIYDILTGTIHYVGKGLDSEFKSIKVSDFNNYEERTLAELVDEFGQSLGKDSIGEETLTSEVRYQASELFVLDSGSSSVLVADNLTNRYYFLFKTGETVKVDDGTGEEYEEEIYIDIYNENADISIVGNNGGGLYFSPDSVASETISYAVIDGIDPLCSFEYFLASNGLESSIRKDGSYSKKDIDAIFSIVNAKEKDKEYTY